MTVLGDGRTEAGPLTKKPPTKTIAGSSLVLWEFTCAASGAAVQDTGLTWPFRRLLMRHQALFYFGAANPQWRETDVHCPDDFPLASEGAVEVWLLEASVANNVERFEETPALQEWAVTDFTVVPHIRTGGIGFYESERRAGTSSTR